MARGTGSYSEHTAEYILAPRLSSILHGAFTTVIPFYFWGNREGTNLSKLTAPSSDVRLLAVFPRRPKMESPSADALLVKLNAELYDHASAAESFGIPVVAGVPLARSLFELVEEPQCVWFAIAPQEGEPADVLAQLDKNGLLLASDGPAAATIEPLSDREIQDLVLRSSNPMTWEAGIRAIRESRRGRMTWWHPFGGGSRKPFHIACIDPLNA